MRFQLAAELVVVSGLIGCTASEARSPSANAGAAATASVTDATDATAARRDERGRAASDASDAAAAATAQGHDASAQRDAAATSGSTQAHAESSFGEAFELADGLEATLWAQSPQVHNPTAIDIDARGRLWVAEAVNYRKWRGRNPGLTWAEGDRVVILEDADGDGVCETSSVFVQDSDLVAPLGIAVLGNRVIVSCSPHALVYTDSDGDDRADAKEVLLTGFGGHDHDHGLHSFVGGPDGALWFNVGNAGPHVVTDRSGFTLRSGSIYNDGGAELVDNRPRLRSDDGRVWTGGLILRVGADGTGLSVRGHNFRNAYELALDSFGNVFQSDNDDDGSRGCRTLWCMEGGDHGYFAADGSRFWMADRRPGQTTLAAHWHQDDPGVVPAGTINGAGGPTGVVVYEGDLLGESFIGCVLNADAGANTVYSHRPRESGAGFGLSPGFLIRSRAAENDDHEAHRFRPSDVAVGIDGSVYVADWYDPGVGGHGMADALGYGRILRIAPRQSNLDRSASAASERGAAAERSNDGRDAPASPTATATSTAAATTPTPTTNDSISRLASPAVNVRWQAWTELAGDGERALAPLLELASSPNPRLRARALWLLARLPGAGRERVEQSLADRDPDLRITAFRALRAAGGDVIRYASILANDGNPRARAEAAVALREQPWERSSAIVDHLARNLPLGDRFYLEALGIAAHGHEQALFDGLAGLETYDPQWPDKLFELAWRLHPPSALDPLLAAARDAAQPLDRRRRALDAIAFIADRRAAESMLDLALAGPTELRAHAAWWVEFRDTNDWSAWQLARQLERGDRAHARLAWSSGVVSRGLASFDVELAGAREIYLVVTTGERGESCDWADWIDLELVGDRGARALTDLGWSSARAGWGAVAVDRNCVGDALVIDGVEHPRGIGTHAASEIAFRIPAGEYRRLTGRCGPDDGGTRQADGRHTDVEFQVWLDVPPDQRPMARALAVLADPDASAVGREAVAIELARTSSGALALVRLAERGALAENVKTRVAEALLGHEDPAVRALASASFARVEGAQRAQPALDEIVALTGDERRGQAIYFGKNSTCSQCHAFRGRGGDVGPDLTDIRKKLARRDLLDHVLEPNKAIELGYQTWTVETADGLIHTGFLLAGDLASAAARSDASRSTDTIVLKDTEGRRVTFAANEVEQAVRNSISVMPDNVALGLSAQELADLAEFLLVDRDAPPQLGPRVALFDGNDLDAWTFHLERDGARMEDVWSIRDGVLHCSGDPIGYLRTKDDYASFVLELDWRFVKGKPPGNSGVLMRMIGPDKVWPKSIEAQLMHRNAGDIWNIDEFPMEAAAERTNGRHTAKQFPSNEKPIGEWNHYRITLRGGDLTLEVNGLVQNVASWCDEVAGKICLQSEGAEIEFKDVHVTPLID